MIKNIYSHTNKTYTHEYFCDNCFKQIKYGEIFRHRVAIDCDKFDLCFDCKLDYDKKERIWKI